MFNPTSQMYGSILVVFFIWICTPSGYKGGRWREWFRAIRIKLLQVIPANTRRWPSVWLILAHRLRRQPNIIPTLGQRLVFAGMAAVVAVNTLTASTTLPANTKLWINVVLMLGQRRRRWANIKATVVQCVVFDRLPAHSEKSNGPKPAPCLTPPTQTVLFPDQTQGIGSIVLNVWNYGVTLSQHWANLLRNTTWHDVCMAAVNAIKTSL